MGGVVRKVGLEPHKHKLRDLICLSVYQFNRPDRSLRITVVEASAKLVKLN